MADLVPVSIAIGGKLPDGLLNELIGLAQAENLSTEWDGEPFDRDQLPENAPLCLYAHEIPNGDLGDVEDFCRSNDLPFVRWSGGSSGAFGPEIIVWTGNGPRRRFAADEDGNIVLNAHEARELGSYEAISQYFAEGNYEPPPFRISTATA